VWPALVKRVPFGDLGDSSIELIDRKAIVMRKLVGEPTVRIDMPGRPDDSKPNPSEQNREEQCERWGAIHVFPQVTDSFHCAVHQSNRGERI
jgi:hypothetical protein